MVLNILNTITPGWKTEYQFDKLRLTGVACPASSTGSPRRWRFDFANPDLSLAVEIEGGIFLKGRHVRGQGYLKDLEKYNAAQLQGWTVLRYGTSKQEINRLVKEVGQIVEERLNLKP